MPSKKKEENRKCKYDWLQYKCNRPALPGDEHCIFHSKDIEGKRTEFNEKFWKEFERQKEKEKVYDFAGFVFPESIDIFKTFNKSTSFEYAEFHGALNRFTSSVFDGEYVSFRNAKFLNKNGKNSFEAVRFLSQKTTIFENVKFSGELIFFERARFRSEKTTFNNTIFYSKNINFCRVKCYSKELSFEKSTFSADRISFIQTEFHCDFIYFHDVKFSKGIYSFGVLFEAKKKIHFDRAEFMGERFDFIDSNFIAKKIYFKYAYIENVDGLFESLRNRGIKRILRGRYKTKDFRFYLGEKNAKKYSVINRMAKDALYLDDYKNNHPFIHAFWNIMAKCGESWFRWALWSLFFALYFAFNFFLIDYAFPHAFSFDPAIQVNSIWSFIYFSVVTFTTLGFGDIIPTLAWVQRWVMAEVIMGYIMLGLLIGIGAYKFARRS